ncbi:MAG TPA: type II secretion system F family protein [Rickettsiales bacterium]|nr:type II secretion system F family protein [Rickettsiales bacterium]
MPILQYLPDIKANDVYMFLTGLMGLVVLYMLATSMFETQRRAARVRSLHQRRALLKGQLMAPRKRGKKSGSSSTSVDLIRLIVDKMNLIQKSQVGKMTKTLSNAGYRSKDAIFIYAFFQLVGPIFAFVVGIYDLDIKFSDPFADKTNLMILLGMVLLGFKLPQLIVSNALKKRYHKVQQGLSDTLDLMMICAEAGLSLAASLDRVSRELGMTYPELAEELALTSIELGFLPDRKKALSNLVERVDIPEIRGVAGVLIQTEKYGTPVAQALRVLAAEFRTQRMLRAEQKAARLPAIMTVPMIVFILPTLFVVILAPALIKLFATI